MLASMQEKMVTLASVTIALCFCFSAIAAENPEEVAKEAMKKCKEELKMSDEKMTDLHNKRMMVTDPKDEQGMCFMECMMKAFKLINKDGEMNTDEVMKSSEDVIQDMEKNGKKVDKDKLRETLEECKNKGKSAEGKCGSSNMMWLCIHDGLQKVIES